MPAPRLPLGLTALVALAGCGGGRPFLYNAAPRASYQAGLYDGTFTIGELRRHGDFGLGATDRNDGELVALDGAWFRVRADGSVTRLRDRDTTPYATVVRFRARRRLPVRGVATRAALEAELDAALPVHNRIYAVRIHGHFRSVDAGAGAAQRGGPVYRPLTEVFAEYDIRHRQEVNGTLVGFRCPDLLQGVDYVGYHYHFLSDDHTMGGHVTDFVAGDVTVEVEELPGYVVALPPGGAFYDTKL